MSHSGTVRILGVAGSLRRGSFNAAALRAAQDLAPTGMTIEISSRTASNTAMAVGRIMIASGVPIGSGFAGASFSISRTMS